MEPRAEVSQGATWVILRSREDFLQEVPQGDALGGLRFSSGSTVDDASVDRLRRLGTESFDPPGLGLDSEGLALLAVAGTARGHFHQEGFATVRKEEVHFANGPP